MTDLFKPIDISSFYLEFDGLTDLGFKHFQTKNEKAIGQVVDEIKGLFAFHVVCNASLTPNSASKQMYEWFQKCLPKSDGGKGEWKESKKNGKISAYNSDSELVAMWEFSESWPSAYKCADLDVTQDVVLEETFTITCEKFKRLQ